MQHEPRITLPEGISEEEFLGLIEGVLAPSRGASVRAGLEAFDGSAAKLAHELAMDRSDLASLAAEPVPAGILRGAMTRLSREHEAATIAHGQSVLPVSKVIPVGRGNVLARIFAGERGRRLALAAGVVLAAGAGVWGIGLIVGGLLPKRATTSIALEDRGLPADIDRGESTLTMGALAHPEAIEVRSMDALVLAAEPRLGPDFTEASLSDMLSVPSELAATLAAEGRLVLTVRVVSAREALAKVEAAGRGRGAPFSLGARMAVSELPPSLASLATPSELPWDGLSGRRSPSAPVVASLSEGSSVLTAVRRMESGSARGAGVRAVYRASIAPDAEALAELRARVAAAVGASADEGSVLTLVYFREVPAAMAEAPAATAAEVLWWSQPTGRWAKRVSVPVVIEE